MTTLTDFLLTRIAEDEDRLVHEYDCDRFNTYGYGTRMGDCDCDAQRHLLAECEAKRRTVLSASDLLRAYDAEPESGNEVRDEAVLSGVNIYEDVLRNLATPYADHPDYREEWKP